MKNEDLCGRQYVAEVKAENPDSVKLLSCTFRGCRATIEATKGGIMFGFVPDRWAYLMRYEPLADGWYCPTHAEAIEAELDGDEDAEDC
jgi:hypothetical protein